MSMCGTLSLVSIGTTSLLHVVTSPYIHSLYEIIDPNIEGDRKFEANRLSVLGFPYPKEFLMSQTTRKVSHPFSSFRIEKADHFYLFGSKLEDKEIKEKLSI